MFNPEHYEKRLAPIDIKTQRRTTVSTVVLTFVILGAVLALLEAVYRIVVYLRS